MTDEFVPGKMSLMKFFFFSIILGSGLMPYNSVVAQSLTKETPPQSSETVKSCEDLQETDANFKKRIVECMGPSDWDEAKLESPIVNH